jgi:hypothetical protein
MKTSVLTTGLATMMLSGCLMVPYPPDGTVMVAPPLPSVVWLDAGPYYYNGRYTYYYQNRVWHYSNRRDGPWRDLPRDRYPREVRHRDGDGGQHRDRGHGQGHGRGR